MGAGYTAGGDDLLDRIFAFMVRDLARFALRLLGSRRTERQRA